MTTLDLPTEYPEAWEWMVDYVRRYGYDVLTMREFLWRDALREEGPDAVLALMLRCREVGRESEKIVPSDSGSLKLWPPPPRLVEKVAE